MKPKFQWDGTLTGWPQWVRVPWLRGLYFPFWRTVNAFRRAGIAWVGRVNLVTDDELMELTAPLDEHYEGWHHPCACGLCRSYSDVDDADVPEGTP
jgi:hypothetical protein